MKKTTLHFITAQTPTNVDASEINQGAIPGVCLRFLQQEFVLLVPPAALHLLV